MTVGVDVAGLEEGGYAKEECVIPVGFNVCRLVSYIEMGHHVPVFMGKKQVYDQGKRIGEVKDPEMMLHLVFEFTNAERTGEYPLTCMTSSPFGTSGDLMNKLSMSKGLEERWVSKSIAMKQNYVKTLLAMHDATGTTHESLADYVGTVFGVNITHSVGKKADDDGNVPTYANMKPAGLVAPSFQHPITKEVTVLDLPEVQGEYCPEFSWYNPTMESWALVPKRIKDFILSADDYTGSELDIMLCGMQEEPAEKEADTNSTDTAAPVDTPAYDPGDNLPVYDDSLPF